MALSHKQQGCRIRTPNGTLGLPDDVHAAVSNAKAGFGYPSMWDAMVQATRLGCRVMEAQRNAADEIIRALGENTNQMGRGGNER